MMRSNSFDEVLTSTPTAPGRFELQVPDGWQAGRGAFGGLVMGAMTRAITDTVADSQPLRTLTGFIPAPVMPGLATIAVDVVRASSSLTTVTARLEQAGEVCALATAVCARARDAAAAVHWQTAIMPTAPAWQDVPVVPQVPGMTPPFARHVDYRLVGPRPFSRAGAATILGYVGPAAPAHRRDAAFVAAMADAYWPAALAVFALPRPTATSSFTLELIEPLHELDPDAPLLVYAISPVAQDGYAFETRELWGHDGRLVARNHQTFVVIK